MQPLVGTTTSYVHYSNHFIHLLESIPLSSDNIFLYAFLLAHSENHLHTELCIIHFILPKWEINLVSSSSSFQVIILKHPTIATSLLPFTLSSNRNSSPTQYLPCSSSVSLSRPNHFTSHHKYWIYQTTYPRQVSLI